MAINRGRDQCDEICLRNIKLPTSFSRNIKNIFTKKRDSGGGKMHDLYEGPSFYNVYALNYIYIYISLKKYNTSLSIFTSISSTVK